MVKKYDHLYSSGMGTLNRIFRVESTTQLVIVFIVFGITGSLSVVVSDPLMAVVVITHDTMHHLVYWPLRIIGMLLVYQVILVAVGALFGQFAYFWRIEKRILGRIGINLDSPVAKAEG